MKMKLVKKLSAIRIRTKILEKITSVPEPKNEHEIGGNLEIERFEAYAPSWACHRQPEQIGITVNKSVHLLSIGLFGSCSGQIAYYQVDIEVRDEKTGHLLGHQSGAYECSSAGPFLVNFRSPITLNPKTTYVITARIKGPDSYRGIKGRHMVETKLLNGKKLKVEFSNANGLKNTNSKWGQIPMVVFG